MYSEKEINKNKILTAEIKKKQTKLFLLYKNNSADLNDMDCGKKI